MKNKQTAVPPGLKKAAKPLGWMALSFLLCAGRLGGVYAPFALATAAAAGVRLQGLLAVMGTAAGALVFMDFQSGLRSTASAILIFAANTALFDTKLYKKGYFRPLSVVISFLLVQSIYLIGRNTQSWLLALCAAAAAAVAAYLPVKGLGKWGVLCALSLAAVQVTAYSFSLGRVLLGVVLLLMCRSCSVSQGAALGGALGLLCDLTATEPMIFYTLLWGGGAAGASAARRVPRIVTGGLAALVVGALGMLFGAEPSLVPLWEIVSASAVYALLPRKMLPSICTAGKRTEAAEPPAAPYAKPAAALRALYDSFFRGVQPPPAENPAVLFDRAAGEVCAGCVLRTDCWQQHYSDTYGAFNDACPKLLRRGRAEPQDFPLYFSSRCVHFSALLQAIDRQTHDYLLRRQFHRQLAQAQNCAREQYACLSELLDNATVPALGGTAQEPMGCRVSASLRPKEGEHLCGDQVDSFSLGEDLVLLLCDGMGSGEKAHREAAMTVRLLRQFLEAGIRPGPALKTLNTAMALRGQEAGSYSTVDLAVLQRQYIRLYKCGAAPSYLKRGGTVRRFCSGDPPAGLSDSPLPPDQITVPLQPGDFLVLISDGVADQTCDEWLLNLLAGWNGTDGDSLTALILSEARTRKGLSDDCAVLTLHLPYAAENQKTAV